MKKLKIMIKKIRLIKITATVFSALLLMLSGSISNAADSTVSAKGKSAGPGFNCHNASGVIEKTICASKNLSKLDLDLSDAYKAAKTINPDIKAGQRVWLKQRNTCKDALVEACLERSYQKRIHELLLLKEGKVILPEGWREFRHSKMMGLLNLRSKCLANEDEKHIRFIDIKKINENLEILELLCDPGAYQDSHVLYLLTYNDNKHYAKPVLLNDMQDDGSWSYRVTDVITGYIQLDMNSRRLIISRRYNGASTCGYVADYSLDDVLSEKVAYPVSARGDNDCYNGIHIDIWPDISLPDH